MNGKDNKKNNVDMNEEEILIRIKESAQEIKAPDSLKPEHVKKQLNNRHQKKRKYLKAVVAAACLCLCLGGGSLAMKYTKAGLDSNQDKLYGEGDTWQANQQKSSDTAVNDSSAIERNDELKLENDDADTLPAEAPIKKLGKMYTLASDYGEVYDMVKKSNHKDSIYRTWTMKEDAGGIKNLYAEAEDVAFSGSERAVVNAKSDEALENSDYSHTNLQVEGVDESDIVKTDGRYIYVVQEDRIQVIDVQKQVPEVAAQIEPELNEDTDKICEMYVADKVLTLIVQTEQTSMRGKQKKLVSHTVNDTEDDVEDVLENEAEDVTRVLENDLGDESVMVDEVDLDAYYLDVQAFTKVLTYDITEPERAVLCDTTTQDGWYQTSRKIDNYLYLFTNKSLYINDEMLRDNAIKDDAVNGWIPCVNEKAVSVDCIYLPKEGNSGFIMTSMDLADHNKVLDTKLVVDNHPQLYVSRNSVYLYETAYSNESEKTRIARFALDHGMIRARAAATVKGRIEDTFAIHERGTYLQVLTSVTSSEPWENRVYVLDENMEKVGKLTGLAEGEMIYSARFVGTIGYFVTYRNTDPLFTVDFSNPREPKIIGELKVTGFSEYLHFWDDDHLLGIGYETDPDSGNRIGVKLSMFNISDPTKVKEEAKLVLKGVDGCQAMYDYKCAFVSLKKNIIAFTTENYDDKYQEHYRVFSYQNGKFVSQLERSLAEKEVYDGSQWRSVYVGDVLYLVNKKETIAFDMKDKWKEIGKVKYVK